MKILATGSNGALVEKGANAKIMPFSEFLSTTQKQRIARNRDYEQTVYAQIRAKLQSRVKK